MKINDLVIIKNNEDVTSGKILLSKDDKHLVLHYSDFKQSQYQNNRELVLDEMKAGWVFTKDLVVLDKKIFNVSQINEYNNQDLVIYLNEASTANDDSGEFYEKHQPKYKKYQKEKVNDSVSFHFNNKYPGKINNISLDGVNGALNKALKKELGFSLIKSELEDVHQKIKIKSNKTRLSI